MKHLASMIVLAAWLQASALAQAPASQPATQPASQPAEKKVDFSKLYTISKETTWVTGNVPLTEDGRVNYVEWLRRHYSKGITHDNNAAVLIVEALGPKVFNEAVRAESLKQLGFEEDFETPGWTSLEDYIKANLTPDDTGLAVEDIAEEQLDRAMEGPWTKKDCPYIFGWLEENATALDKLIEASKRSRCYFPVVAGDNPSTVLAAGFPALNILRNACRALVARAMLKVHLNEDDIAWVDLIAISRLARLVSQGRSLIEHLVAMSMATTAAEGQRDFFQCVKADSQQCLAWLKDIQSFPPRCDVVSTIDIEYRTASLDAVMTVMRASVVDVGVKAKPDLFDWDRMLRKFNDSADLNVKSLRATQSQAKTDAAREIDELFEWIEEKRLEGASSGGDILNASVNKLRFAMMTPDQKRNEMTDRVTATLLSVIFPSVGRSVALSLACDSYEDLALLVAALETYKAKEGKYPAELGDLVKAGLLKELPKDPFSKEATADYIYKPTENGYVLYGLGKDADDDGGAEGGFTYEGDIVFSRDQKALEKD